MKFFFNLIIMVLCLFGLTINNAFAQTENSSEEETVMLKTEKNIDSFESAIITTDTSTIVDVNEEEAYAFENHSKTNYFISPSFIPLEKKNIMFRNLLVTSNQLNVGVTKNLSIGVGFDFLSIYLKEKTTWNFSAKLGFEVKDNIYIGGGVNYRPNSIFDLSIAYSGVTFGDGDRNLTAGLGFSFNEERTSNKPILFLSGMYRISGSYFLVTENIFLNNPFSSRLQTYSGIHGMRYVNNIYSIDLGLKISKSDKQFFFKEEHIMYYVGCKLNLSEIFSEKQ